MSEQALVERLNEYKTYVFRFVKDGCGTSVISEAADRIEELEAIVEKLRAADKKSYRGTDANGSIIVIPWNEWVAILTALAFVHPAEDTPTDVALGAIVGVARAAAEAAAKGDKR